MPKVVAVKTLKFKVNKAGYYSNLFNCHHN